MNSAIELDPLDSAAWENLGLYMTANGDYVAARSAVERSLSIEPDNMYSHYVFGQLDLLEGKPKDALAEFQQLKDPVDAQVGRAMVEHSLGHEGRSQQVLDVLIAKHAADSAYQVAEIYAWRGESNKAFEWLERAYRQRESSLADIAYDIYLSGLRHDPRFDTVLRKLSLIP